MARSMIPGTACRSLACASRRVSNTPLLGWAVGSEEGGQKEGEILLMTTVLLLDTSKAFRYAWYSISRGRISVSVTVLLREKRSDGEFACLAHRSSTENACTLLHNTAITVVVNVYRGL